MSTQPWRGRARVPVSVPYKVIIPLRITTESQSNRTSETVRLTTLVVSEVRFDWTRGGGEEALAPTAIDKKIL